MIDSSFVKSIADLAKQDETSKWFETIQQGDKSNVILVDVGGGKREIVTLPANQKTMQPWFGTVKGFITYVNDIASRLLGDRLFAEKQEGKDRACAPEPTSPKEMHVRSVYVPIFVCQAATLADFNYGNCTEHRALLTMAKTREYNALLDIVAGVSPKTLWRRLIADLSKAIDGELLLTISSIKMLTSKKYDIEIQETGITSSNVSENIGIAWTDKAKGGAQGAKIKTEWTWKGRIFRASEKEYWINLRMEIENESETLTFKFHPENIEDVLEEAIGDIVKKISDEIKPELREIVKVYEGKDC